MKRMLLFSTTWSYGIIAIAAVTVGSPLPVSIGVGGLTPEVTLALIGGAFTFLAFFPPIVTLLVQAWITRRAKQQEWDRLDKVVSAAKIATEAAQQSQADAVKGRLEVARLLAEHQAVAAASAKVTADHLVQQDRALVAIHTLVNEKMTTAIRRALKATVGKLHSQKELYALTPSVDLLAEIAISEQEIAYDRTVLVEREFQQALVDAQIRTRRDERIGDL